MTDTVLHADQVTLERNRGARPLEAMIDVVVPVFNEQESIGPFLKAMDSALVGTAGTRFRFFFVNDGSSDATLSVLEEVVRGRRDVHVISLSRNFGKEAALTAGLDACSGDAAVVIDVDLQDPPALVPEFVARWRDGYDVVVGMRVDRTRDGWAKRVPAEAFYQAFNAISDRPIPINAGDFRLIDRRVVEALKTMRERTRFMKGIFSWVGFPTCALPFERMERSSGMSSMRFRKLWNFALDGMFSFSGVPLKVWSYIGGLGTLLAAAYALFIFVRTVFFGVDVPGYASLMILILVTFSCQMITIGIVGEYVHRIFVEVKQRPLYLVDARLDPDQRDDVA